MKWEDFYNFYRIIEQDNLSLFYSGNFSDEITVRLIDLSELSFSNGKSRATMRKKVSFLMAECFQNVIRHTDVDPELSGEERYPGFFMTRNVDGNYYIASGNLIRKKDIENLRSKIDDINKLDKNELKSLYMKVLGTEGMSAKGGAGLGLIDMARKSGRKLDAEFLSVNKELTNFYLQIYIDQDGHEEDNLRSHLQESRAVYLNDLLRINDVIMAYQGDFNQDSVLPLLTMIDQNMLTHPSGKGFNKNLYHVMVEILQNIMHHGQVERDKTEGVFSIGLKDNIYHVDAANYIDNNHVTAFRKSIEDFLSLNNENLKTEYKRILREGPDNPNGGAGLGVIDIIRMSRQKPEFRFEAVDDHRTLFYLKVLV